MLVLLVAGTKADIGLLLKNANSLSSDGYDYPKPAVRFDSPVPTYLPPVVVTTPRPTTTTRRTTTTTR